MHLIQTQNSEVYSVINLKKNILNIRKNPMKNVTLIYWLCIARLNAFVTGLNYEQTLHATVIWLCSHHLYKDIRSRIGSSYLDEVEERSARHPAVKQ